MLWSSSLAATLFNGRINRKEPTMYICLCNGFTEGKVRLVAERGECKVADVYKALGCKPKCGKCVPFVRDLIRAVAPSEPMAMPSALLTAGADC